MLVKTLTSTGQVADVVTASALLAGPATWPPHQVGNFWLHDLLSHLVVGHYLLVGSVFPIKGWDAANT